MNENESIDKMAREFNNKRRYNNLLQEVNNNRINFENGINQGLNIMTDPSNVRFGAPNLTASFTSWNNYRPDGFNNTLSNPYPMYPANSNQYPLNYPDTYYPYDNNGYDMYDNYQTDKYYPITDPNIRNKYHDFNSLSDVVSTLVDNTNYENGSNKYNNFNNSNRINEFVKFDELNELNEYNNLDEINDLDIESNYSSLTPNMKLNLKERSVHLKKDLHDIDTINHIKSCKECRTQLKNILLNNPKSNNSKSNKSTVKSNLYLDNLDTNNILVIILLGIFVIIILDIICSK